MEHMVSNDVGEAYLRVNDTIKFETGESIHEEYCYWIDITRSDNCGFILKKMSRLTNLITRLLNNKQLLNKTKSNI